MAERGLAFLALSFSVFIRDSCRYYCLISVCSCGKLGGLVLPAE